MSLLIFLVITVILCSLILLIQAGESKWLKILAVSSIGVEIIYILLVRDVIDPSLPFNLRIVIPAATGVLGLVGLIKTNDRPIPMLIFFSSLIQFFMETKIIDQLK